MKQKLAILIYSLGGGGAERVLLTLIPILQEHFTLKLFVLEDKNHYESHVEYEVIGTSKSSESAYKKFLNLPFLAYAYANRLKQEGISLSFSLLNRPNYINLIASRLNTQIIPLISEHATPSQQYKGTALGARVNRFLIRSLYKRAAHIITVSQGVRQDLITHFQIPETLITAVYNPFNLQAIQDASQKNETSPSLQTQRMIWVSIGRLDAGKNHLFLLKAMKMLKEKLQEQTPLLLILGEGELKEMLQNFINEHDLSDCVSLEGFVKNPYAYIKMAHLTLSSSLYEGFLNVLVESLALGVPPVSSDCPSGPREILDSQSKAYVTQAEITPYGILFPIPSSCALSEGECLEILTRTLIDVIQGRITFDSNTLIQRATHFDDRIIAEMYIHILKNLTHV